MVNAEITARAAELALALHKHADELGLPTEEEYESPWATRFQEYEGELEAMGATTQEAADLLNAELATLEGAEW